jgi:hypothetical protein
MEIATNNIQPLTEQKPLTEDERAIVARIVRKKLLFIIPSYVGLVMVLIIGWIWGGAGMPGRRSWTGERVEWDDDDLSRFALLAPYVMGFLFILLTIYLFRHYQKTIRPFIRDTRQGVKTVLFFTPEKYKTPIFDAYYIKTPFRKPPMIRISRELYDAIDAHSTGQIAYSPSARFVFFIEVNGHRINYNESNSVIDM